MRVGPSSRSLTGLLTSVSIVFCGCVRSPAPRFYALSSIQEGQDLSSGRSPVNEPGQRARIASFAQYSAWD
jgi:hypothetical protein